MTDEDKPSQDLTKKVVEKVTESQREQADRLREALDKQKGPK